MVNGNHLRSWKGWGRGQKWPWMELEKMSKEKDGSLNWRSHAPAEGPFWLGLSCIAIPLCSPQNTVSKHLQGGRN